MKYIKARRIASLVIASIVLLSSFAYNMLVGADEVEVSNNSVNAYNAEFYNKYFEDISQFPVAEEKIFVKAVTYLENKNNTVERLAEYKGTQDVLMLSDNEDSLEYNISVPKSGRYEIVFRYYPMIGKDRNIELGIEIDGKDAFPGSNCFKLNRLYKNETEIQTDQAGNQYSPRQVEYFDWLEMPVKLLDGTVDEPIQVYLTEGEHKFTINTISQPYVLDMVTFVPPENVLSYESYCELYDDQGGIDYIKIEAENATVKSDKSLRPDTDRTSPLTTPYDAGKVKMNILSSNWSAPGQWVEWDFDAPSDGWYNLGFRYQQYYNIDFFVTRRLYIDGKLPYREAADLHFNYNLDWTYTTLKTSNGEPMKVYLEKGKHKLRMEVALGAYADMLEDLDYAVEKISELYRQIIMITGVSPDKYQDYYLEREIPGLMDTIKSVRDILDSQYSYVKEITNSTGAQASILQLFSVQLTDFLENPEEIDERLSEFKNNIGSLAAWILDLRKQPMELDYIYLYQKDATQPKEKANVFEMMLHEIKAFVYSFITDYNTMNTEGSEQIEVWVGSSREKAQIIKSAINELYTPKHNIGVNLKLVTAGMEEAFLSGKTPDVVLSVGRGQPLNLAVRGALMDLSQFRDFEDVKGWFVDSALEPYYFENGCFGIPDTQNFYMMFYRTDIFDELEISPPKTWEEFYSAVAVIQRLNMEVGIPYTTVDASGAVDAGLGVRNIFPALLLQNGGRFYNESRNGTALGTEEAIKAFYSWCKMYSDYGLPISYNFYNRFRTGEMPLAIASYTEAAQLESAAPEIQGMWKMTLIPGTTQKNGSINHSQAGSGTACVILSDSQNPNAAWDFLKWYCSAEAQARYANDIESEMGVLARPALANREAMGMLGWSNEQYEAIEEQRKYVEEVPEVLGGYYVTRGLDNAFREVVYENKNARESLILYNSKINDEIRRKREEFNLE